MKLFFRKSGQGKPLIILHGLYGASDNWYSIGKELSERYTVYLVDQRNHGNSPHSRDHNYQLLSDDLNEFMMSQKLDKAYIMGHSMGGKTALAFGLRFPEKSEKMVIVDISPLGYDANDARIANSDQMMIIKALMEINLDKLTERAEADRQLTKDIPSVMLRQFLLKSLKRSGDGKFTWAINVQSLYSNMPEIFEGIISEDKTDPRGIPEFPLLFIKAGRSDYIQQKDISAIEHFFPWAEIKTIQGADHWVHAEQPEVFVKTVREFLNKSD